MKTVKLTQNKRAIVDDEDFYFINQYKWHFNGRYAVRNNPPRGSKLIRMHRIIADAPDGVEVDHINGDRLDNRKSNLRLCNHSENGKNISISKINTSGYKGVSKNGNCWRARIRVDGKLISLGYFREKTDAAMAYNHAAKKYFGEFAKLNEIENVHS
jgi:hypothetical protein